MYPLRVVFKARPDESKEGRLWNSSNTYSFMQEMEHQQILALACLEKGKPGVHKSDNILNLMSLLNKHCRIYHFN